MILWALSLTHAGARLCSTYLSKRGLDGWSTENLTPVHVGLEGFYGGLNSPPFKDMYFNSDLSRGVVTEQTFPLTSGVPRGTRKDYIESMYLADLTDNSYQFVESQPAEKFIFFTEPMAASTDLSHLFIETGMSEWVDGQMIPVGIGNGGESLGAGPGTKYNSGEISGTDTWHAMSADGSRVFMTTLGEFHGRAKRDLYVRVNVGQPQSPLDGQGRCTVPADACTIEVSASHRAIPDPNAPFPARFWAANVDGSKVFFSSKVELTEDAYTGPEDNRPNLYEYDVESGVLTDLTVDTTDPKGADLLGVMEISEDGSYVYFVAKGDLASGATFGQPNLYVSHDGGALKFIATLANSKYAEEIEESDEGTRQSIEEGPNFIAANNESGNYSGDVTTWVQGPQQNKAAVTPAGTRLAFFSERSLTGYDNERAENDPLNSEESQCREEEKCREVYLYDASTSSLVCASCNPSGARPLGPSDLNSVYNGETVQVRQHNFSDDGSRLFFQGFDGLVPRDSNGHQDVYEYEDGRVSPISNVASGFDSRFLDASPNGGDVFVATAGQLLPRDSDLRLDIYDARANGGYPVTSASPGCDNGDSCKPPPTAQPGAFGAPASATFSGAGNIAPVVAGKPATKGRVKPKACKKGFVKKRAKCVKRKTKRSSSHSKKGRK